MAPFIVIEALDAGGSQTQTNLLARRCKKEGYRVLQLHFPQEDRASGRLIYDKFLLHKNKRPFSRREQALLYIQDFFSRAEDISGVINQSRSKQAVISDRYITSTMAYQTMGLSGREWQKMYDWIWWLAYEGTPVLPTPDLIIFLDTPVDVSLKRLRGKKLDFFETEQKLTAIRDNYLKLAKKQQWVVFNSVDEQGRERSRQDLHKKIWQTTSLLIRN